MSKWYPLFGFENKYGINRNGDVISFSYRRTGKPKIIKATPDKDGYLMVTLCLYGKSYTRKIHRLLCETFKNNPNNLPEVNHKDGNKKNNNLSNLEWCTRRDNAIHALENGLKPKSTLRQKAAVLAFNRLKKKKVYQYSLEKILISEFDSLTNAGISTGVDDGNIGKACKGIYNHAGGFIWSYIKL